MSETQTHNKDEVVEPKKLSPKNKLSRGVSADTITTWVPFDHSKELNTVIRAVAAFRGTKTDKVLADILGHAVKMSMAELEADASKYVPVVKVTTGARGKKFDDMTEEELKSYEVKQRAAATTAVERAQKAADAAKNLLAKARQRHAEANNAQVKAA